MGFFIMIAIAVWLGSMVVWYIVTNVLKSQDVDKIKSRLAGKEPKVKVKAQKRGPALIETEATGRTEHFAQVRFASRMAPGAIVQARVIGRGDGHLEARLAA